MDVSAFSRDRLFNAEGLVAVITGGGTGIGWYFAQALAANGAKAVYITGRRLDVLEKSASQHPNVHALQCDVTSKDSLKACAEAVRKQEAGIDILVANAGADPVPHVKQPANLSDFVETMWSVPQETFNKPLEVNVTAVFYTALAFLPLLESRTKQRQNQLNSNPGQNVGATPQILITSSISGFSRIPTGAFAYSASKAGVTHMGKQLSTYLAPYQIRVNVFSPGMIPSEMTADRGGKEMATEGAVDASNTPAKRWATEEDVASVALFMMSNAGAYLNGSVVLFDGGRVSVAPAAY